MKLSMYCMKSKWIIIFHYHLLFVQKLNTKRTGRWAVSLLIILRRMVSSYMALTPEQKKDLSSYRLQKSRSLIEDAQVLFKNGSYESSINRAYYAVLSAAKALLILRGIDPETHDT